METEAEEKKRKILEKLDEISKNLEDTQNKLNEIQKTKTKLLTS